jgi:hypothetical protein
MSERETEELEEMDQIIRSLHRGGAGPQNDATWRMAQQLVEAAARIQPRPDFARGLRARLLVAANIENKTKKSAMNNSNGSWLRRFTMKRTIYAVAGLAAVAAIAFLVVNLLPERQGANEQQVAVVATEAVATEVVAAEAVATKDVAPQETSTLAPTSPAVIAAITPGAQAPAETVAPEIPVTEPSTGLAEVVPSAPSQPSPITVGGRGGGGGGGDVFGRGGLDSPFVDAQLTLTVPLPDDAVASVYDLPGDGAPTVDLELLRDFAARLGMTGELYFDWYPGLPVDGSADEFGNGPSAYRIFEGSLVVMAYGDGGMSFNDASLNDQYGQAPLPFQERAAVAESYASERGLLDFDYEIHDSWGHEVQFLARVDGRTVTNWPQLAILVAPNREIMSITYRPLSAYQPGGEERLRSAQSAWEYLQEQFQAGQLYYTLISADPAYYAPPAASTQKINWQREFAPGQEVDINSWIQILRPADGSITPLALTDRNMLLAADAETLEAMAAGVETNNSLHLRGALSGEPGNLVLNVSSWEAIQGPSELYLSGTSRGENGQVFLELPGGFRIHMANPPADLPLDAGMSLSTWGVRPTDDGCGAITEWLNIDLNYQEYVEPGDPTAHDPYFGITAVTIDEVALVYQNLYPGEAFAYATIPYRADNNFHLVPAWRFSGQTNKGDVIEFIVPAPSSVELPVATP